MQRKSAERNGDGVGGQRVELNAVLNAAKFESNTASATGTVTEISARTMTALRMAQDMETKLCQASSEAKKEYEVVCAILRGKQLAKVVSALHTGTMTECNP